MFKKLYLQFRMLVFRFETTPAALNFALKAAQSRFVLRLEQMAGLTHRLQP